MYFQSSSPAYLSSIKHVSFIELFILLFFFFSPFTHFMRPSNHIFVFFLSSPSYTTDEMLNWSFLKTIDPSRAQSQLLICRSITIVQYIVISYTYSLVNAESLHACGIHTDTAEWRRFPSDRTDRFRLFWTALKRQILRRPIQQIPLFTFIQVKHFKY